MVISGQRLFVPLATRRERIIKALWSSGSLPSGQTPTIVTDVAAPGSYGFSSESLDQIDKWTFDTNVGSPVGEHTATVYVYRPVGGSTKLALVHDGHTVAFTQASIKETLQFFVENGFIACLMTMPLLGDNTPSATDHTDFIQWEPLDPGVMRSFLDGCAYTIDYAEANESVTTTVMVGLSGGGWTTVVYAALDERVRYSSPVAGWLPFDQRVIAGDVGDFEQQEKRPIFAYATYKDLAAMGCTDGRWQTSIYNDGDDCCFASSGLHTEWTAWRDEIRQRLAREEPSAGTYEVMFDDNNTHTISSAARSQFLSDLQSIEIL